jgi:DNA-binding MarR family transcriptional regulator
MIPNARGAGGKVGPLKNDPNDKIDRKELGARIALRILRASHIMERDANRIAQEAGLTLQQWFLLNLLVDEGGTTSMSKMARFSTVTRQNVAAMVQRMVAMGMVTVARDPNDRRSALVSVTDEGRKRLDMATPIRDEWTEGVFRSTDDADLVAADKILRTLYRAVAQRAMDEEALATPLKVSKKKRAEPDTLW